MKGVESLQHENTDCAATESAAEEELCGCGLELCDTGLVLPQWVGVPAELLGADGRFRRNRPHLMRPVFRLRHLFELVVAARAASLDHGVWRIDMSACRRMDAFLRGPTTLTALGKGPTSFM
jgi:hypothetical protein